MKLTVVLCLLFTISAVTFGDEWIIEFVDICEYAFFTSIEVGADNYPHISYSAWDEYNDGDLRYVHWNGSSWDVTPVVTTGNVRNNSLALSPIGAPRIAYWDNDTWDLKYASWNGSSWVITTIDGGTTQVGPYCALCIDGDNQPSIAYYQDWPNPHLRYARRVGSTWYLSDIDTGNSRGWYVSMALDDAGKPHVAYYSPNGGNLMYAVLGAEYWSITTVDAAGDVGIYTSIAVDSNGRPHISYWDKTNGNLKYARYNGSQWYINTIDDSGDVFGYTSIALDEYDRPHISYHDSSSTCLMYASFTGSYWAIEEVDNNGSVGTHSSLAIDGENRPHISYRESLSGPESLKYAYYGLTGIEEEGVPVNSSFSICPNPCAGSATVTFSIPVACRASLELFDISGRKVADLADGVHEAGVYQVPISGLENGIYFSVLRAGDITGTARLVVLE